MYHYLTSEKYIINMEKLLFTYESLSTEEPETYNGKRN